jgi:hypothetical protein
MYFAYFMHLKKKRLKVPEKNRVLRVIYGGKREKVAERRHKYDRSETYTTLYS